MGEVRRFFWVNGKKRFAIWWILLALFVVGCAKAPYTNRNQLIMMSVKEELAMGYESSRKLLNSVRTISGPDADRVSRIGKRIAAVAERPDFTWEFHTVKDDVANAFCLPGGKIFVYTGLFTYATNDDELAAVVGHEVGHAIARHGAERFTMEQLGNIGAAATAIAVGVTAGSELAEPTYKALGFGMELGIFLPYSRVHEIEADHVGLILMAKAGYDPRAALSFWEKFRKQPGKRMPEFFSTHPSSETRIEYIRSIMPAILPYYEAAALAAAAP